MPVFTRKFKRKIKIFFALLAPLAAIAGYAYFMEPNTLKTENQTFKLKCLEENVPEKFVQISDLHFTGQTKEARINKIYETIKEINPAAIFLTGDLISNETGIKPAVELSRKISENFPTYAVFGNWDYWALDYEIGEFKKAIEDSGVKVLINDEVVLDAGKEKIVLLGVKDPYTSGDTKSDLEKAAGKISGDKNNCVVLLAHSPDIIQDAKDAGVDLVLTGHTHGGQVYIPFLSERFMPVHPSGKGFISGLYEVGGIQVYVNRGIGLSAFPFRIGASPEVTVISLEVAK